MKQKSKADNSPGSSRFQESAIAKGPFRGANQSAGYAFLGLFATAAPASAGMTVYVLTDVVRWRIEDLSFFIAVLLLAALGVRILWNYLARDFTWLPRLNYRKAFSLTCLLGLAMVLVLLMIAGARELLTPGAWARQGSHYRPSDLGNMEMRQQSLEGLRAALLQYAHAHQAQFPPHDFVPELPAKLWQAPDTAGTRYIYVSGLSLTHSNQVLACEPRTFGNERLALFANGKIEKLSQADLYRLLGTKQP